MVNVLVGITNKETAQKLLDFGKNYIKDIDDKLIMMHIGSYEMYYMGKTEEGDDLEYIHMLSLENMAENVVIRSNNITATLVNFIKLNDITHLVLEDTRELRSGRRIETLIAEEGLDTECIFLKI